MVQDALEDPRFRENPLVQGPPNIRFYAGAPLEVDAGIRLGSFCIIDDKPRATSFTERDAEFLKQLASLAVSVFDQYLNRSLFEASPSPIFILDLESRLLLTCNDPATTLLGYTALELEHASLTTLLAPVNSSRRSPYEPQSLFPGDVSKSCTFQAKNGQEVLALVTSRKLSYFGRAALLLILTDITEITEAQEQLRSALKSAQAAVQAKRQLLSTVSHELRTPLNHVLSMASLLLEGDLTADQKECAQIILTSAHHLEAMVTSLLEFTRQGNRTPDLKRFSPADLVSSTESYWVEKCSTKALEFQLQCDCRFQQQVIGDSGAILQVLNRLISNAVKFTPDGGVKVQGVRQDPGSRPILKLIVTDTGIGISPQIANHIFEPFTHEDSSNTRQYDGIGLSLAICKRIVDGLGGSIDFVTSKGIGSSFWFEIPVDNLPSVSSGAECVTSTHNSTPTLLETDSKQ